MKEMMRAMYKDTAKKMVLVLFFSQATAEKNP